MSFSKTVSVFAALATIFVAGTAGWKLANESQSQSAEQKQDVSEFQEKINQLEQELKQVKEQPKAVFTQPLPPLPPVPEPKPGEFE